MFELLSVAYSPKPAGLVSQGDYLIAKFNILGLQTHASGKNFANTPPSNGALSLNQILLSSLVL